MSTPEDPAPQEESEPIPAPGGPGLQNVVNQPEENMAEPGTGPKQPGHHKSHTQMLGESNEDFQQRVETEEQEAADEAEAKAAEQESQSS